MARVPNTDSPKTEGKRFLREFDRQVKEIEERERNRPAPSDPPSKDIPPQA